MNWSLLLLLITVMNLDAQGILSPNDVVKLVEPVADFKIEAGSFVMEGTSFHGSKLTVHWCRAVDKDSKPAPRSRQLVCYNQFPSERFFEAPTKSWHNPMFRRIARETGCSVYGVYFSKQSTEWDDNDSYIHRGSGSFEAVIAAGIKVCEVLEIDAGRPWVSFGNSGGASVAQRMADVAPERFHSVVSMGGSHFIQARGSQAAFLILNTMGDATQSDGDGLVKYLQRIKAPYLRWVTMPVWKSRISESDNFEHVINQNGFRMGLAWLSACADLFTLNGSIGDGKYWPVACDPSDLTRSILTSTRKWQQILDCEAPHMLPSVNVLHEMQQTLVISSDPKSDPVIIHPAIGLKDSKLTVIVVWPDGGVDEEFQMSGVETAVWDAAQLADYGCRAIVSSKEIKDIRKIYGQEVRKKRKVALLIHASALYSTLRSLGSRKYKDLIVVGSEEDFLINGVVWKKIKKEMKKKRSISLLIITDKATKLKKHLSELEVGGARKILYRVESQTHSVRSDHARTMEYAWTWFNRRKDVK